MQYTFQYFNGYVHGWWLILKPGDNLKKLKVKSFSAQTIQNYLDSGKTICLNQSGGYHLFGENHKPLATVSQNSLNWAFEEPAVV